MIRREKGLELMIFFNNLFEFTFGSNMFLTLKIIDFENVTSLLPTWGAIY
jgi:hypothetical protein